MPFASCSFINYFFQFFSEIFDIFTRWCSVELLIYIFILYTNWMKQNYAYWTKVTQKSGKKKKLRNSKKKVVGVHRANNRKYKGQNQQINFASFESRIKRIIRVCQKKTIAFVEGRSLWEQPLINWNHSQRVVSFCKAANKNETRQIQSNAPTFRRYTRSNKQPPTWN